MRRSPFMNLRRDIPCHFPAYHSASHLLNKNCEYDLKEFFAHETQVFPPSHSEFCNFGLPSAKSGRFRCFEQSDQQEPPGSYDCKALGGPVVVHSLPNTVIRTFDGHLQHATGHCVGLLLSGQPKIIIS